PAIYAKKPVLRRSPYHGLLFNGSGRAIDLAVPAPTVSASAGGNKTLFLDTADFVPNFTPLLTRGGGVREGAVPGALRITVAQSAALQTLPRTMRFYGSRYSQYSLVGNAVPP